MLFRDPVDGVGGRPHLGVPPRAAVPGKAGVSIGKKKSRSIMNLIPVPMFYGVLAVSLIVADYILACFKYLAPMTTVPRDLRDIFENGQVGRS